MARQRNSPLPGTEARKEYDRARTRLYKKTHKEKVRVAAGRYREKYRTVLREKQRLGNMSPEKREQQRQYRRDYHAAHAQALREYRLAKKYGLSSAQFNELLQKQDGCCALCKKPFDTANTKLRPAVDHDHGTGAIRGILHGACNSGLGFFNDDPEHCGLAAAYLLAHRTKKPGA